MRTTPRTNLPAFLAFSLVVELLAGITSIPNHINVGYNLFIFILGILTCGFTVSDVKSYLKWLCLPAAYIITFIIVSYYGVNFAYSVKYHVLYMPFGLAEFSSWYMVGYFFHERQSFKIFYKVATFFGLGSMLLVLVGLVDPELTRAIYGLDLPIAMPLTVLFGDIIFGGLIIIISVFSIKKTVVLCTAIGLILPLLLKKSGKVNDVFGVVKHVYQRKRSILPMSKGVKTVLLVTLGAVLITVFFSYMIATITRFSANEDVVRGAIALEFLNQLFSHFPAGTGFYTFGYLTSDVIEYWTFTASGDLVNGDGVALHNTFMHFALEGGLPIIIIVIIFYRNFFRAIRFLYRYRPAKGLAIVLISWCVISIVYGMFQQLHGTRYFLGIFGFAFGAYERYKRQVKAEKLILAQNLNQQ
ncbi:MAG TPA: hypothetical protein VF421_05785 [Niabella sp.]